MNEGVIEGLQKGRIGCAPNPILSRNLHERGKTCGQKRPPREEWPAEEQEELQKAWSAVLVHAGRLSCAIPCI